MKEYIEMKMHTLRPLTEITAHLRRGTARHQFDHRLIGFAVILLLSRGCLLQPKQSNAHQKV